MPYAGLWCAVLCCAELSWVYAVLCIRISINWIHIRFDVRSRKFPPSTFQLTACCTSLEIITDIVWIFIRLNVEIVKREKPGCSAKERRKKNEILSRNFVLLFVSRGWRETWKKKQATTTTKLGTGVPSRSRYHFKAFHYLYFVRYDFSLWHTSDQLLFYMVLYPLPAIIWKFFISFDFFFRS